MPKPDKFIVINDALQNGPSSIRVGSAEWFAWLAQHEKFSFQGKDGHFIAQREMRRDKAYWYAYRRRAGKLFKLYLGKSDELTLARLAQISLALAGQNLPEAQTTALAAEVRIDTSFLPMTRVNIPALPPQIVRRPRLLNQIKTPLTLIYAPSGFGKSTLLNDWKQTCGYPVAWLLLDDGDNHALRFWGAVIVALQTILPDFGKELLTQLRGASVVNLSDIVSRLTDEMLSLQPSFPRFCLALDDFHHIHNPEIYDSIQSWVKHMPANMQLVILGHNKPPLALGDLRARGILTELDANDLRFTLDEGIHYLQQYHHENPLAYTDLEKLVKHTEGWAAGLTLSALALGKQEDRRQFIDTFSGAHIYLREYFMETVLQHCSPEMQSFLLKTAILKHLTGSLCDALTGQTGGGDEMLSHLWQENLFIVRLEQQGWYRYHDLFAEMLASQLRARFPDEIPQLHQRAAQWYREQFAPADAVYHLLSIKAWEEAAALIEEMALRELEQFGEDSRLLRWLQELPVNVVQKHKTLLLVYLRLADVALPKQQIENFISAIESNLSSKPRPQQNADEREALVEIQRIRSLWKQGRVFTPPLRENHENDSKWAVLNGLHLLKQAYHPNPALWEEQIVSLFQEAQARHNLFVVLMAGGFLARRAYLNGQLRRSEKIAQQVLEHARAERKNLPEPASISLTVLSQIHLERNELVMAQRTLTQAQEVDPNPASSNMLIEVAIQRAKIQAAQGKHNEALATMRAARALHTQRPSGVWTDQQLLVYEAAIFLRNGDILSAEGLMGQAESAEAYGLSQEVRAEILLRTEQAEPAEKLLTRLVTQAPSDILSEPLMNAHVLLSLALMAQHKTNQALQVITDAVRMAAPEHFFRPFMENRDAWPLLLLALKTEKLTADAQLFIKHILQQSGQAEYPQVSDAKMEALSTASSISQREQEVLQLLSNAHSNREIAETLSVSESTIKTHLGNIYYKLGVKSRIQAVKRAKELNLV